MIVLLRADRTILAVNNDWGGTAQLTDVFGKVGAFPLPDASKDAAIFAKLAPGSYTVQVTGATAASGMTLLEIYEVP